MRAHKFQSARISAVLLVGALATYAAMSSAQTPGAGSKTVISISANTATYRCDSSGFGHCAFVLYTRECTDTAPKNGKPTITCVQAYLEEFTLAVGASKTRSDLPPNVHQCQQIQAAPPSFPDCAR